MLPVRPPALSSVTFKDILPLPSKATPAAIAQPPMAISLAVDNLVAVVASAELIDEPSIHVTSVPVDANI